MINWRLYVILDKGLAGDTDLKILAGEVIGGGADVIQLRDKVSSDRAFMKDAEIIRAVTRDRGIPFIINDRSDIAKSVDADGVHLGQDDIPVTSARSILGKAALIGVSCRSLQQADNACREGADYIGLGPIFKTQTKPDLDAIGPGIVAKVREDIDIPVICIGGINIKNIKELLRTGARSVAIASAIIKSDKPRYAAREIKDILEARHDTVGICQE